MPFWAIHYACEFDRCLIDTKCPIHFTYNGINSVLSDKLPILFLTFRFCVGLDWSFDNFCWNGHTGASFTEVTPIKQTFQRYIAFAEEIIRITEIRTIWYHSDFDRISVKKFFLKFLWLISTLIWLIVLNKVLQCCV